MFLLRDVLLYLAHVSELKVTLLPSAMMVEKSDEFRET